MNETGRFQGLSTPQDGHSQVAQLDPSSAPFIGQWNQLVSTTNWEKGRIISAWRDALVDAGAPAAEYSDEAWARLVGGVTSQHVGRLRRVFQRFGDAHATYDGLYWSHFHSACDWDDAEMWLEGAVQNRWSVSQMRQQRWETLGGGAESRPSEADEIVAEVDEDVVEPDATADAIPKVISGTVEEVVGTPGENQPQRESRSEPDSAARDDSTDPTESTVPAVRPFENLAELPDDLADAFEAFKLAILRHKADQWKQISRADVMASLDALKELAVAPSVEEAPF